MPMYQHILPRHGRSPAGVERNVNGIVHRRTALPAVLGAFLLAACGGANGPGTIGATVQNLPLAYVKRPLPDDPDALRNLADPRNPLAFTPGGDLLIRDLAAPGAAERNLTAGVTGGMGDVRDVSVSYDGKRLLFALHAPEIPGADPADQPTWNIWEYDLPGNRLRRVIASANEAEEGQDVAPAYLPDGRIVFASSRQRRSNAIRLDEGKPQFAALDENRREPATVLHVMNADGSDVHQISYNQSHDLYPAVLASGEIVFSRWDHMGGRNAVNLYTIRPDGTELHPLYGAHSHATGSGGTNAQFLRSRPMTDGHLLVMFRAFSGTGGGGDIVEIDAEDYLDILQPVSSGAAIAAGVGQVSASGGQARTDGQPSLAGRYGDAYPLWDGTHRALVSWAQCRVMENGDIVPCTPERLAAPNVQEAPPLYGIFVLDLDNHTQRPLVAPQEGFVYSDVVAMQARSRPDVLLDKLSGAELDPAWATEKVGVLDIRSVYDFDGRFNDLGSGAVSIEGLADPAQTLADQRPARFLRVVKGVGIPDDLTRAVRDTSFGRSEQQKMREIIGYVPIEPDGSVRVKVPADVPLAISVLDRNGRRIGPRHQNWIQVRPGETLRCNGCHDHGAGAGHADPRGPAPVYVGATVTGLPFPNTLASLFADYGDTMAETRTRLDPDALTPRMDLVYDDVWTDETAAGRPKDAPLQYLYADLTTPEPEMAWCQPTWNYLCRVVINYPQHIHPLWGRIRAGGNTCTDCHASTDAMSNPQVPAGQLDLSDGPSLAEPDHLQSYRALLFDHDELRLDPATNTLVPTGVTVAPILSTGGAAASADFFALFDSGGTHAGRLDPAELRLIAEWLDIGAQYYNNPFDAPSP